MDQWIKIAFHSVYTGSTFTTDFDESVWQYRYTCKFSIYPFMRFPVVNCSVPGEHVTDIVVNTTRLLPYLCENELNVNMPACTGGNSVICRSQRFCNHCTQNVLGDEINYLLSCSKFAVQRKALFDDLEVFGNIRNGKDFKTFFYSDELWTWWHPGCSHNLQICHRLLFIAARLVYLWY